MFSLEIWSTLLYLNSEFSVLRRLSGVKEAIEFILLIILRNSKC